MKVMTFRFSDEDAETLAAIAKTDGRPVSSLLREAVALVIAQHRKDPAFRERLAARLRHDQRLLERLAE
jgi:predicted DNA-binding protein